MSKKSVIDAALPLAMFIRRQQVLSLFRKMMRTAQCVDGTEVKNGLKEEIRRGFQVNKNLKDKATISATIKEAQRNLEAIKSFSSKSVGDDSWMKNSDPDDQRGRVGVGWPWEKNDR